MHQFQCTWQHSKSQYQIAILNINMNKWSHLSCNVQGTPWIAFSSTMGNFLLHFSHYCIALNPILPAYITLSDIPQLSIFITVNGTYAQPGEELQFIEESRSTPWESTRIQECSQSSFPIKYLHFNYLPSCIILWMTNISNCINEAGWWYRSGHWWWRKWRWKEGLHRVQLIIWYRRWRLELPAGGPTSWPGTPREDITNIQSSIAKETEPYRYCYCTPSAPTLQKTSLVNSTTTAHTPKVHPTQQIIGLRLCTIRQRAAATQV